jgi:hypothetical protein
MNIVHEGTTRATHEFPVLEKREEASWASKRRRLFWICMAVAALLCLFFLMPGLYSYLHHGINEAVSVPRDGQYRLSTEEMMRKDFEKWSAARLKSFENRLQRLQKRADMVRGEVRSEAQQKIEQLKGMHALAQARFSKLQNAQGEIWNDARRDMITNLRNLEKTHYRAATRLTGFMF